MNDFLDENNSNKQYKANVAIQDREAKYGDGITQRVIEMEVDSVKVGFAFGDITKSLTDAIMCPTTPWLELGNGAVEWAIAGAAGKEVFEVSAKSFMDRLRLIYGAESKDEQIKNASLILRDLDLESKYSPEIIVQQSLNIITSSMGKLSIKYGSSFPVKSGNLSASGIDSIILTNVTPDRGTMTRKDMAMFTQNSIIAAKMLGIDSITIPAIGTGFAAALGFGLSYEDSIRGFIQGVKDAEHRLGQGNNIKKVDYNIYATPSLKSASNFIEAVLKQSLPEVDFIYQLGE